MELLVHSQSHVILYLSVADLGVDPGVYEEYGDQLLSDLNKSVSKEDLEKYEKWMEEFGSS